MAQTKKNIIEITITRTIDAEPVEGIKNMGELNVTFETKDPDCTNGDIITEFGYKTIIANLADAISSYINVHGDTFYNESYLLGFTLNRILKGIEEKENQKPLIMPFSE